MGDWMSEANMTSQAAKSAGEIAYEPTFLEALAPALKDIARHQIKIVVNAGASDPKALRGAVNELLLSQGLASQLKIAYISGDDVLPVIQTSLQSSKNDLLNNTRLPSGMSPKEAWMENVPGIQNAINSLFSVHEFQNLCNGERLRDWDFREDIVGAQAYLGGLGIAAALRSGADIVLAGRVSDASPVIGAVVWWHAWEEKDETWLDKMANAFVAGHLIECSNYVTGGNCTIFKELEAGGGWRDIGYPIAEVGSRGEVVITKQRGTNGVVNTDTCKAQLLYEIQGPCDVTAILDQISVEQIGTNRVRLHGVKGAPSPPTTKIGITARGGYQAEVHWFLVGLDIATKARMLELQVREALSLVGPLTRFHVLKFTLNGTAAEDPTNQTSATVDFRVFAQARNVADIAPDKFLRPIIDLIMCSYPGATFHLDFRQGIPKPVQEYFVTLLPQDMLEHKVHLWDGRDLLMSPPQHTKSWPRQQPSVNEAEHLLRTDWGETVTGPLGWLVHARSGDKGSNANVGFWVRHSDEYDWLRWLLSTDRMKALLAKEYNGKKIDRFELPNLWAVHFLLHDHLDRGVSCSSTYDFLGKNVAEFLRSRHVELPVHFLNRGKL
ncbi:hypothetical protein BP5796_07867 [Coleophoma crateriformis]|uniref:DUF1446-domain-containing protein n=1 Tax=Coleophoma crateriformis TaxID=565419 RepID=A0A3D8RCQ1_9HELO|nr:hypothetical protein BP5796_07867 [Coleophoma crateriformis]